MSFLNENNGYCNSSVLSVTLLFPYLLVHVNGGTTTTRRNTSIDTLTIVTGTAGGLLGFLLVIVAFVIYQRRKLMRRMRRATARRMRSSEDERMLIYCSNDFHFFLPTYDEAVRSRPAEPPPFEAVVNNGEQTTQTNDEGNFLYILINKIFFTQLTGAPTPLLAAAVFLMLVLPEGMKADDTPYSNEVFKAI